MSTRSEIASYQIVPTDALVSPAGFFARRAEKFLLVTSKAP